MDHSSSFRAIPPLPLQMPKGGGAVQQLVLIDRTAGSNIGDMSGGGGLSAAFDGNIDQAVGSAAQKASSSEAYVGKTLAAAKIFGRAIAYGANDSGFGSGDVEVTITVRGKAGAAPASFDDGTAIGSVTFTDTADATPQQIESSDLSNSWDHLWITISAGVTQAWRCAELVLYESLG